MKSLQIRSFFWSVFSSIRTEYGKVRTRRNSTFGPFSHSIKLKIKFFNGSVLIVPLYATNSYVIDTSLLNKINVFQKQCLVIVLNINKEDHVTYEYAYKLTSTQPLMNRVTKTQLSFLGHSIRRIKNDLVQQYCLYVLPYRQRSMGQQKTTYK